MRILLLGEYSNLHWTLAQGLRELGHEVFVVSSGDQFKSYQNDIFLKRDSHSFVGSIKYITDVFRNFSHFRGFDIVQVINPIFLELKAERHILFFNYLKRFNGKIFMGAFGDDYYWIKTCLDEKTFRYSEFDFPGKTQLMSKAQSLKDEWIGSEKENLNKLTAEKCDGIVACLYEYYASYKPYFEEKLSYIPAPINTNQISFRQRGSNMDKVRFFIGISGSRSQWKGTDIMLSALLKIEEQYPDACEIIKVESVPYAEYVTCMNSSDVILDQLYSYSPAMNALTAMAMGLIAVSGGEPETYELLGEEEIFPIVNVFPSEESVYQELEKIILNRAEISKISLQSRLFVEKHHDYRKVAQQYLDFWESK